jgi:uncharacterized protein YbjT (DUF2867 family)
MAEERPLILVIGATGVIGKEVMRSLDGRCRLRALVHNDLSDVAVARRYPRAERVQCDLLDGTSLAAAFAGVDRMFLLTPSVHEQARLEENALTAALAAEVQRIVYVSSTDVRWEIELSAAHRATERLLADSGVQHTVLRPEYLLDNLLTDVGELARGRLVAPSGGGRCSFLDARDAGAVAAAVLLSAAPPTVPLDVTGPEMLCWTELGQRLEGPLGLSLEHVDPKPAEWAHVAVSAGMTPWLAGALAEYFITLRDHPLEASNDVARVIHRNPRSVEDFAREVLAPAMPPGTVRAPAPILVPPSGDAPQPGLTATVPTPYRRQHA